MDEDDGITPMPSTLIDDAEGARRRLVRAKGHVPGQGGVHQHERALPKVQLPPAQQIEERVLATRPGSKADPVGEPERRVMLEAGRLMVAPCLGILQAEVVLSDTPMPAGRIRQRGRRP